MVIKPGEKVHVMQRRAFETDVRRHFIGEVTEASECAMRVIGYAFVYDKGTNQYVRRPERRERLVSLVSGSLIINIISPNAKVEKASYVFDKDGHLCVTDGETLTLDINEFGANH